MVPASFLNQNVEIFFKFPFQMQGKGGQMGFGFPSTIGKLIEIVPATPLEQGALVLRNERGECAVLRENIHHVARISDLTLASNMPPKMPTLT